MLRTDEVTGLTYDDTEAADRREAEKQRRLLADIEAVYGPISPSSIERDKREAYSDLSHAPTVNLKVDALLEVARCHWRRSVWANRDRWRTHPDLGTYLRAYNNTTFAKTEPEAWDLFRAQHPYTPSKHLPAGTSYWT